MPLRDIALTAFILGLLPAVLARPWIGVLLWTWIGLMNPHKLTWSFAYNFQFALIVGVATIIGVLISREPKRFPFTGTTVVLLLFNLWMFVTTLFALYPDSAWTQFEKVAKIQVGILLTLLVMQSKERILWLTWVAALSLAFYGVKGGIFTIRSGGSGMVLGPPGGFIAGNTEIALAITMVTPLLFFLAQTATRRWLRWGLYTAIALCFVAVLGTFSRGGLLALIGMGTFLWWKSRKKLALLLVIFPFAVGSLAFLPDRWFERMETIKTHEDSSAQGRLNAWAFALNLAGDRPIVGGGFETFRRDAFTRWAPEPEHFQDSHSIWFEVLGEHGYVGLGLFIALWWLVWRDARATVRLTRSRPDLQWAHQLVSMVQVSLIGYWVGGSFLGLAYFDLPYILLAIVVLTRGVVEREVGGALAPQESENTKYVHHGAIESGQPASSRPIIRTYGRE